MRAIISLQGGLIQNILSDEPLVVLVIDQDDPQEEDDRMMDFDDQYQELTGARAFVQVYDADFDECIVEDLFGKVESQIINQINQEEEEKEDAY
jgi:hypothetical protein